MATEAFNDWSPWKRALLNTMEVPEEDGVGGDSDPGGIAADAQRRSAEIPTPTPPRHRINDDTTSGTRGVTPDTTTKSSLGSRILSGISGGFSSIGNPGATPAPSNGGGAPADNSGYYTGATSHPYGPQYPLERQIGTDQATLNRMNQPTKTSLLQRIGLAIGAGAPSALAGQDVRPQAVALRDKSREDLANRISANTRALSQEQMQQEGMNLRERMAERAQEQQTNRLLASLGSREREGQQNRESKETIAANTETGKNTRFATTEGDKLAMFANTDEFRRWKTQLDNDTKMRIAALRVQATQNKAPAALMQTAVFAKGGLDRMASASAAMQRLEQSGVMGQSWFQNQIEDSVFGSGAVDPRLTPQQRQDVGVLRAALGYTSSAAMRAHTGRTSQEIYNDFKSRLGPGQDWNALRGAMQETGGMLTEYATAASDANIAAIRGGYNVAPTNPTNPTAPATNPNEVIIDLTQPRRRP